MIKEFFEVYDGIQNTELPFFYDFYTYYLDNLDVINVMYNFVYCASIRNKCHHDNDGEYLHRLQSNYTFCELYILQNALCCRCLSIV